MFVYTTCVPALISDDVVKVCQRTAETYGKPIIPVNAPGFAGTKNLGNKLGGEALLDHVIGTQEPERTTPYDINILGEYNVAGELWQVKSLFDRLGATHQVTVSYRGTRDLIFAIGNSFIDHQKDHGPDDWRDRREDDDVQHVGAPAAAG